MKIYHCKYSDDGRGWTHYKYTANRNWAIQWQCDNKWHRDVEEINVEDWPESPAETTSEVTSVAKGT